MKNRKKLIGLVNRMFGLVLCLALLLVGCAGQGEDTQTTAPTGTQSVATADTALSAETTRPPETTQPPETTEATETTVVPEETEPTEPPEENTNTGGSGYIGVGGVETVDPEQTTPPATEPEEEQIQIPAAGSRDNAYTEYILNAPDSFATVKIPVDQTVWYHIFGGQDLILTVNDPDVYVIWGEQTLRPEEGVITLELGDQPAQEPLALEFGNSGTEEKACVLQFTEALGGRTNPQILESVENISLELKKGKTQYALWTAPEGGLLSLTLGSVEPAQAGCTVELVNGDAVSVMADGQVSMEVKALDQVQICISVQEQAKVDLTGSFTPDLGSENNPYILSLSQMPETVNTEPVTKDEPLFYHIYGAGETVLTVEDGDAYITYNGQTYLADENGVVTVWIPAGDPRVPAALEIGNRGAVEESYALSFAYRAGHMNNPVILENIEENLLQIPEGCDSGYFLRWTATDEGVLKMTAEAQTGFDLILTNTRTWDMAWLSDGSPVALAVQQGDVIELQIAMEGDADGNYPAAQITALGELELTYGTEKHPWEVTVDELPATVVTEQIPAGGAVYYSIGNICGASLTVADPDMTVTYNGQVYAPDENGVITLQIPSDVSQPDTLLMISNGAAEDKACTMELTGAQGTAGNMHRIYSFTGLMTQVQADTDGYYYAWTAADEGVLALWVDGPASSPDGDYDVILTNTTSGETAAVADSAAGTAVVTVAPDDEITVRVYSKSGTEAAVALEGSVFTGDGTAENPYLTTITAIPGGFATVDICGGQEVYYDVYRIGDTILSVEGENVYVIYDGVTYTPDNGVVTLAVPPTMPMQTTSLVIGSSGSGEQTRDYLVRLVNPLGVYGNPEILEDIASFAVDLEEGNETGYYLRWTAPMNGTLSIRVQDVQPETACNVTLTNLASFDTLSLSETGTDTVTMTVAKGDEISIVAAVLPNEENEIPAARITMAGQLILPGEEQLETLVAELTQIPGQVTTQAIPGGKIQPCRITGVAGTVLTVEDAEAYVLYDGKVYDPDSDGVIRVEIPISAGEETELTVGNGGDEERAVTLSFAYPVGSVNNPEEVYALNGLTTTLMPAFGGYCYSWSGAWQAGAVSFCVDPEGTTDGLDYDVVARTSSGGEARLSDSATGAISLAVAEGDTVTVQVLSDTAGTVALEGCVYTGTGEEDDPYMTTVTQIPWTFSTADIPDGKEVFYNIYRIGDTILTIEGEDAYVIYDGVTYTAADGVVTVKIGAHMPMEAVSLIVGNAATEGEEGTARNYRVDLVNPVGTYGNPLLLDDISTVTVALAEGNEVGYYLKWVAGENGTITFALGSVIPDVGCNVTLNNAGNYEYASMVDSADGTVSVTVSKGDEITIVVSVLPDESYYYAAAEVILSGTFSAG